MLGLSHVHLHQHQNGAVWAQKVSSFSVMAFAVSRSAAGSERISESEVLSRQDGSSEAHFVSVPSVNNTDVTSPTCTYNVVQPGPQRIGSHICTDPQR